MNGKRIGEICASEKPLRGTIRATPPAENNLLGTMMDYPLLLGSMLERAGKLFPHAEVVSRQPDHSIHRCTYRDIRERSRRLACGLQLAGLQPGDRVGSLMWNHYAHLECYFGVPMAGGVLHTLNLRLHPEELAYIINHGGDRFLIVDDVLVPVFEAVRQQVNLERVFVVSHYPKESREGYEHYDDLLSAPPEPDTVITDEHAAAAMCYTSGTTGRPRGIVYSHRALALHTFAAALPDAFCLSHRNVFMPLQPMFHANAWGFPFMATMLGAKQVLPGPYLDAESLLELITQEQVTMSGGVPTVWAGVLDALEAEPQRWKIAPGFRMMIGGAAPPESLIRGLDRHGLKVIHAWGMTETSPVTLVNNLKSNLDGLTDEEKITLRCKQGISLPYIEARIADEQGCELPADGKSAGELQVRGPWVASDYYQQSEGSHAWSEDGWFKTGDVAAMDPEGYVKLVDRAKDLIKSGGEWISSVDIENALMTHAAIKEAAVIGVADSKWGERPLAVVVLRPGSQATSEELAGSLRERFAKWQIPDSFVFLPALPHTSTGKVSKAQLRLRFKGLNWERAAAAGN